MGLRCMEAKVSNYDIVDAHLSPRPIKELAAEAKARVGVLLLLFNSRLALPRGVCRCSGKDQRLVIERLSEARRKRRVSEVHERTTP
jgi:hypothetical protein